MSELKTNEEVTNFLHQLTTACKKRDLDYYLLLLPKNLTQDNLAIKADNIHAIFDHLITIWPVLFNMYNISEDDIAEIQRALNDTISDYENQHFPKMPFGA